MSQQPEEHGRRRQTTGQAPRTGRTVEVKEEGSFFPRGFIWVKALEIPNNEDADVAKACAVVLDPHRPPAVMADVESVISALKAKTPSWRSCVAAAARFGRTSSMIVGGLFFEFEAVSARSPRTTTTC